MGRVGGFFMGIGFVAVWPLPVVGVLTMVVGAVCAAIAAERSLAPDLADAA
jgi:hypothetical protein